MTVHSEIKTLKTVNTNVRCMTATVTDVESNQYRLNNCFIANRSFGCLVEPIVGDRVLVFIEDGQYTLYQVIERQENLTNTIISASGASSLTLHAKQLCLSSTESTQIQSLGDIDVMSCSGKVTFQASKLILNAIDSLLHLARNLIQRANHIDTEAESLLKTHAHHQLITAKQDIKIDAERINIG